MSSNSRWFLDTQHSFSFKAQHEILLFTQNFNKSIYTALNYRVLYNYSVGRRDCIE